MTAAQIANTTATAFDVGLRYFASGALYTALTAAHLANFTRHGAAPALLSGWTELDTVAFEGSLTHDWTENAVTWAARLRGWSYDAALLAPGFAIACTYRITRSGYDSGWLLDWVGVIDANDRRDDYRKGAAWAVTVRSAEATLLTTDAAYLVLGAENVAEDGASVSASSTLATPEAEAGTGEYVGTTITLSPDYVVDDDMRTLWISQDPPNLTEEAVSTTAGSFIIDEVFAWPLPGYDAADVWWLELLCPLGISDLTGGDNYWVWARNADGDDVVYWPAQVTPNAGVGVGTGERLILCGRRTRAEAYCGGFHSAAQAVELSGVRCFPAPTTQDDDGDWIWDYTTVKHFSLHATDGYILFGKYTSTNYDMVVWGNPTLPTYYSNALGWTGGGFNPPAAKSGYSIRRAGG